MPRFSGLLCTVIALLLLACSPERKLAREYVKQHTGNGIMIIPIFELYKDNLTITYDTNINYSQEQLDSIAWEQSCYIKDISDSVFLTSFTNSMIKELTASNYDVYVDEGSDIFLSLPDPKWVVHIAQLRLDEDYRYEDLVLSSIGRIEPYTETFRVNQVNLKSWFEVSRTNTEIKQVLFLEGYIQDHFHKSVNFNVFEGSIGMTGKRDSLKIANVYLMAEELGQKHGELLFDYFLNDYIRDHLPPGIVHREYYHYNRQKKSLKRGLKERFDVVN